MPKMVPVSTLSEADREKFMQIVQGATRIRRHSELFLWLQGEFLYFLPHDVLISISGNFDKLQVSFDVVSAQPGLRTDSLLRCQHAEEMAQRLHQRWIGMGQQMFAVSAKDGLQTPDKCDCAFHASLSKMKSILVHGLRDERSGYDSLYVMMHTAPHNEWQYKSMFELLVPHIDMASRRIASLPMASARDRWMSKAREELESLGISPREEEILEWVTLGKTNHEIGIILNISAFTVKNHLQRIFKKLDVLNRVQAVAKLEALNGKTRATA